MRPAALAFLALAMSTDAFAAAIGKGAGTARPGLSNALRTGLLFGTIEGITPIIGWGLGMAAAQMIAQWDHWIAFVLLTGLGAHMIYAGMTQNDDPSPSSRQPLGMLMLTALATSIDALVIGISLAFFDVNITLAALAIGVTTMVMVTTGMMLGNVVGQRAEIAGGVLLMALGSAILYEHLYAPMSLQAFL
ncbi:manganese efflux pump MntP [Kushneria phyllosphaerae]|uniref:Putative manganese efflux pump MntP n=1 Tax=Kushneria phyllosphaerae TaxID=2100822 RepID=A0A2R8CID9_9GAMM|nr:manganese efflux pump MntP family protein [Kushneria phyllosphaerae]SPJ32504.1 putative manganese efflux pump MntP [Kushneria phyllosphaerae]